MNRRQMLVASAAAISVGLSRKVWADTKIGGEINVLSWGNYVDYALPSFEQKYGTKVNIDYYADEKEAMVVMRGHRRDPNGFGPARSEGGRTGVQVDAHLKAHSLW